MSCTQCQYLFFFFFNDTATTEIYTLSLHDALPISRVSSDRAPMCGETLSGYQVGPAWQGLKGDLRHALCGDRKSTRLNSSHVRISYAVFCLKKKNTITASLII